MCPICPSSSWIWFVDQVPSKWEKLIKKTRPDRLWPISTHGTFSTSAEFRRDLGGSSSHRKPPAYGNSRSNLSICLRALMTSPSLHTSRSCSTVNIACVCFLSSYLQLRFTDFSPFLGMRKFTRAAAGTTTQDETLCQVQVKRVGITALRCLAVRNISPPASSGSMLEPSEDS